MKPKGPKTNHLSLSPTCLLTVGIEENKLLISGSVSTKPLLVKSNKTEDIPQFDFRATNKFLAPTAETSPSIVTNLLANSKEFVETNDLDKLISTPST